MSKFTSTDLEIMSGQTVFAGTRVLVQTLFDYLQEGSSIDEFLLDFPTVSREQVVGLLVELRHSAAPESEAA